MNELRILLADDHQIVLSGLRTVFGSQKGWRICGEAITGREAIKKAHRLKPNVVVMEFSMPQVNGLEATREIRKRLPDTEVLIFTMHEAGDLAEEAMTAGARGFVLKTEANRQLIAAVRNVARHRLGCSRRVSNMVLETVRQNRRANAPAAMKQALTPREREVLRLIAEGKRSKEIAVVLEMNAKTVDVHRNNIMRKLDLHSAVELAHYALREKLVEL